MRPNAIFLLLDAHGCIYWLVRNDRVEAHQLFLHNGDVTCNFLLIVVTTNNNSTNFLRSYADQKGLSLLRTREHTHSAVYLV